MDLNSDQAEIFEEIDVDLDSTEKITDLDLEIKIEVKGNIKTGVIEETNNSGRHQIIGEKRKNQERSNSENRNKKIKEEFVDLEESDYKQEPQEVEDLNLCDSNNQVINIWTI